jgi:hypothetical protein
MAGRSMNQHDDVEIEVSPAARSRSVLGRLWRGVKFVGGGPLSAFGPKEITGGARLIARLADQVRGRRGMDPRVHVGDGRSLDVEATADACGISVDELEDQLRCRRRETARLAYATFGLGWFLFGLWLYRAAFAVWSVGTIVTAVEFAPFCAVFFLMAFRSALENYQLRTRRLATAMEYLGTPERFWPS